MKKPSFQHAVALTLTGTLAVFAACTVGGGPGESDDGSGLGVSEESLILRLGPTCITVKRGSQYGTIADTLLAPGMPTTNFGSSPTVSVSGFTGNPASSNIHALLRADLNANAIPPGASIVSADLFLYPAGEPNGQGALDAFLVTSSWQENPGSGNCSIFNQVPCTGTTFNNFPSSGYQTPAFHSAPFSGSASFRLDLTQQMIDWWSGKVANNGILLAPSGSAQTFSGFGASSSENPPSLPALVICYEPSPCAGVADGTSCKDDQTCTVGGTCLGGVCQGGQPAAAGTVCRAASGGCDTVEVCDGVKMACPKAAIAPAGQLCRATTGPCDIAQYCNGGNAACPAQQFAPATQECRHTAGPCDPTEYCTGSAAACPSDVLQPSSFKCSAALGPCENDAFCDGTHPACPANTFKASGTVCKGSNLQACEAPAVCDGTTPQCPANGPPVPAGSKQCSNGTDCTLPTQCDGVVIGCQAPQSKPDGTACPGQQDACHPGAVCHSGSCTQQVAPDGTSCGAGGATCQGGSCNTPTPCGGYLQACCSDPNNPCPGSGPSQVLWCTSYKTCAPCGNTGQDCCEGTQGGYCPNGPGCDPNFNKCK